MQGYRIFNDCIVGNNCTFQASSIIGSDGFGFVQIQMANTTKYLKLEM